MDESAAHEEAQSYLIQSSEQCAMLEEKVQSLSGDIQLLSSANEVEELRNDMVKRCKRRITKDK